jgi:hypothetical protein
MSWKHHFRNAANCFEFRNIFKRCNFELPATFAAALADAFQLQAFLVFAQEELVTLSEKMQNLNKKFSLPTSAVRQKESFLVLFEIHRNT